MRAPPCRHFRIFRSNSSRSLICAYFPHIARRCAEFRRRTRAFRRPPTAAPQILPSWCNRTIRHCKDWRKKWTRCSQRQPEPYTEFSPQSSGAPGRSCRGPASTGRLARRTSRFCGYAVAGLILLPVFPALSNRRGKRVADALPVLWRRRAICARHGRRPLLRACRARRGDHAGLHACLLDPGRDLRARRPHAAAAAFRIGDHCPGPLRHRL